MTTNGMDLSAEACRSIYVSGGIKALREHAYLRGHDTVVGDGSTELEDAERSWISACEQSATFEITHAMESTSDGTIRPYLPDKFSESYHLWLTKGVYPGEFFRAVLENNLCAALASADPFSVKQLPHIVAWLTTNAPCWCWGSRTSVARWHAEKAVTGSV